MEDSVIAERGVDAARNDGLMVRRGLAVMAAAIALLLAGCSPAVGNAPSAAPSSTPDALHPTFRPTRLNCDLLLSDAHAAQLSPPLTPVPSYSPPEGTLGAAMAAQGGQACGWGDGSTTTLEVVAIVPLQEDLDAAKQAASTGEDAPAPLAEVAYFAVGADGVGRAQIFFGSYWLEVASPSFATAAQAASVYENVIRDLRSAGG